MNQEIPMHYLDDEDDKRDERGFRERDSWGPRHPERTRKAVYYGFGGGMFSILLGMYAVFSVASLELLFLSIFLVFLSLAIFTYYLVTGF
jgi:hypothetical protein